MIFQGVKSQTTCCHKWVIRPNARMTTEGHKYNSGVGLIFSDFLNSALYIGLGSVFQTCIQDHYFKTLYLVLSIHLKNPGGCCYELLISS